MELGEISGEVTVDVVSNAKPGGSIGALVCAYPAADAPFLVHDRSAIHHFHAGDWTNVGAHAAARTGVFVGFAQEVGCLLYTSPSPREGLLSRMPSSA